MGFVPEILNSTPLDLYQSPDGRFQYYSFIVVVKEEFIPQLNNESAGYLWCNYYQLPRLLHPGTKHLLFNRSILRIIDGLAKKDYEI